MLRLIDRLATSWLNWRYPLPEGWDVAPVADYDEDYAV